MRPSQWATPSSWLLGLSYVPWAPKLPSLPMLNVLAPKSSPPGSSPPSTHTSGRSLTRNAVTARVDVTVKKTKLPFCVCPFHDPAVTGACVGGGGWVGGGCVGGGCVGGSAGTPFTTSQSDAMVSFASPLAVSLPAPHDSRSAPGPPTRRSFPAPP